MIFGAELYCLPSPVSLKSVLRRHKYGHNVCAIIIITGNDKTVTFFDICLFRRLLSIYSKLFCELKQVRG